jgi:hypothetical protein
VVLRAAAAAGGPTLSLLLFVCVASAAAFDAGEGSLSPFLGFSFRLLSKQVQIYCYLRQLLCPVVSLFFFVFFELVLSI